jgi:hypothetical protein
MKMTKGQQLAYLQFKQELAERTGHTTLEFKHTISRGRGTYGYNIVTLYADGVKVARCFGGGYDMQGTVLGDYIQERFQAELLAIRGRADYAFRQTVYPKLFKTININTLYGMTFHESYRSRANRNVPPRVVLDGATGFSSMESVLRAIGWSVTNMPTTGRNIYILSKE